MNGALQFCYEAGVVMAQMAAAVRGLRGGHERQGPCPHAPLNTRR
jgi:hypothetical protein